MSTPEQNQQLLNRDNVHEFKNLYLQLNLLTEHVEKLDAEIAKYKKDRESLLIWGILGMGAIMVAMGALLAKFLFPGLPK